MLDNDMKNDELRLRMGELTAEECRVAKAAIKWANRIAADEIERLRKGINDYLTGYYDRPVGRRWREDREPCKHDKCVHDKYMWDECEPCIDMHFENVTKLDNSQPEQQDRKSEAADHIGDD